MPTMISPGTAIRAIFSMMRTKFQAAGEYNKLDFEFPECDVHGRLQTFQETFLPQKPYKWFGVAALYPLPQREYNGADHSRGLYAWAVIYANETPTMVWEPAERGPELPHSDMYLSQHERWRDEREGRRAPSYYMLNTQYPDDARTFRRRAARGIPLTGYQGRVVGANGWPYPLPGDLQEGVTDLQIQTAYQHWKAVEAKGNEVHLGEAQWLHRVRSRAALRMGPEFKPEIEPLCLAAGVLAEAVRASREAQQKAPEAQQAAIASPYQDPDCQGEELRGRNLERDGAYRPLAPCPGCFRGTASRL